jgi:hypothetical protein
MRFLVVTGEPVIFRAIGQELATALAAGHQVSIAVETQATGAWAVLRDRIRRSGVQRGLDQFAFKVFDLLCLRRREGRAAQDRLQPRPVDRLSSLNAPDGLAYLRAGRFDVVICIASSIVRAPALALPVHGFVNIHPGVLPEYRGTGNLWAVAQGDWERVGYTVHWMTERIDVGRIVSVGRLHPIPGGLWALHVAALRAGAAALADLVQRGTLLEADVDVAGRRSHYFGWYGFGDYLRFTRMLRERPDAV